QACPRVGGSAIFRLHRISFHGVSVTWLGEVAASAGPFSFSERKPMRISSRAAAALLVMRCSNLNFWISRSSLFVSIITKRLHRGSFINPSPPFQYDQLYHVYHSCLFLIDVSTLLAKLCKFTGVCDE